MALIVPNGILTAYVFIFNIYSSSVTAWRSKWDSGWNTRSFTCLLTHVKTIWLICVDSTLVIDGKDISHMCNPYTALAQRQQECFCIIRAFKYFLYYLGVKNSSYGLVSGLFIKSLVCICLQIILNRSGSTAVLIRRTCLQMNVRMILFIIYGCQ